MGVRNWITKSPDREQWRTKYCNAIIIITIIIIIIIIIITIKRRCVSVVALTTGCPVFLHLCFKELGL